MVANKSIATSGSRQILSLLMSLGLLASILLGVPFQASAQEPAEPDKTEPAEPGDTKPDTKPAPPRPHDGNRDGVKHPTTGVPQYRVDPETGRTIWNLGSEPIADSRFSEAVEYRDGSAVKPPTKKEPTGFVAGQSQYLTDMSDDRAHFFANPDGTITAVYTQTPSQIDPKTGELQGDAIELIAEENGWTTRGNSPPLHIPDNKGRSDKATADNPLVSFSSEGGEFFELRLVGQNPDRSTEIVEATLPTPVDKVGALPNHERGTENRALPENQGPIDTSKAPPLHQDDEARTTAIKVDDLTPDIDARIIPVYQGVRVDFITQTPEAAGNLIQEVTLPKGWTAKQGIGSILLINPDGESAGIWGGGVAWDAEGNNETDVSVELLKAEGEVIAAQIVVDPDWLADDSVVFPVTIDPTIAAYLSSDTWVEEGDGSDNSGSLYLRAGMIGTGPKSRSYLKFDSWFDDGFRVESADLLLRGVWANSCAPSTTWIRRVTESWVPSATTWLTKPAASDVDVASNIETYGIPGCEDNWITYDVSNIVDHWALDSNTNHGFEVLSDENPATGTVFKQFFSKDHQSWASPYLNVTYSPYGVEFSQPLPAAGQGPQEAQLPQPHSGPRDPAKDGAFKLVALNTGALDWPSGSPLANASGVCLSYHATGHQQTPPAPDWAGMDTWPLRDGARTCPTAQSNMFQVLSGTIQPNQTAAGWNEWIAVDGADYATPGVRDVYFSVVQDGPAMWWEVSGNDLSHVQQVRWTAPPQIVSPISGSVFSTVEPISIEIDPPYDATSNDAWAPSEYRVRVFDPISEEEVMPAIIVPPDTVAPAGTVSGATITITPDQFPATALGSLIIVVEARDADNEYTGGPQHWTAATTASVIRNGVVLGIQPHAEIFDGVNAATGNYYRAFADFAPAGLADGFGLTRHLNTLDDRVGIFGPGIVTSIERTASIYSLAGIDCVATPTGTGCRIGIRNPDGSGSAFEYDGTTWIDTSGSPTTGEILNGNAFELTFKDGARHKYASFNNGYLTEIVNADGHKLSIVPNPAYGGKPGTIRDEVSGREIILRYVDVDPTAIVTYQVDKATMTLDSGGSQIELDWNYSYIAGFLKTACDPRDNCVTFNPINHDNDPNTPDKFNQIITPANAGSGSIVLGYDNGGRVTSVQSLGLRDPSTNTTTIVELSKTELAYPSLTEAVITDGRQNTWTVTFDNQDRTLTRLLPGTTTPILFEYDGPYLTKTTDATGYISELEYDDDGNLLSETLQEQGTSNKLRTYYQYDSAAYVGGSNATITGPSHICDSRSTSPTVETFCTVLTYDTNGHKLTEQSPEQTTSSQQSWTYTDGSSSEPAGLLKTHTNSLGGTTGYKYFPNGDLEETTTPGGLVTTFTYDNLGRVKTESATYGQAAGSTVIVQLASYTYDANSNVQRVEGPVVTNTISGLAHQMQSVLVYDANNNLRTRTESDLQGNDQSRIFQFYSDGLDREVASIDPEQGKLSRLFDASGNVIRITDANGNSVQTSYSPSNLATDSTALAFDDGHGSPIANRLLSTITYDDAGRIDNELLHTSATASNETDYQYDSYGRDFKTLVKVGSIWLPIEETLYGADGFATSRTLGDPNSTSGGNRLQLTYGTYDTDGRVLTQTTEGRDTTFTYDSAGNVTTEQTVGPDPVTSANTVYTTNTTYDSSGRIETRSVVNDTGNLVTSYDYDERDLLTATTDPRGNETGATAADFTLETAFDILGRPVLVTSPNVSIETASNVNAIETSFTATQASPTVESGYDTYGNLTHVRNELAEITITEYDRNDRRTRVNHPTYVHPVDGTTSPYETWDYDPNGNVNQYRTRLGNITDYAFDDANRVTKLTEPAIPDSANPAVLQPRGETQTFYDYAGQVTKTIDAEGAVTQYTYDEIGQVETQTVTVRAIGAQPAQSGVTSFAYSDLGYLTSVTDPEGIVTSTTYDAFGSPLTTSTGGLDDTVLEYDGVGRPRRVTQADPNSANGIVTVTSYDLAGRATSVTETGSDLVDYRTTYTTYNADGSVNTTTSGRGGVTTYSYDNLSRLTGVELTVDGNTSINYSYGYDAAGNTTRVTDGDPLDTLYVYNEWGLMSHTLEPKAIAGSNESEADRLFKVGYNNGGQANYEVSPGTKVLLRDYNQLALPTLETSTQPGSTTVGREWSYTRLGQVARTSHPTSPTVFTYDDRGLLVTQTGGAGTASFSYDTAGRTLSRDDDAGDNTFTYNATTGLPETVTNNTSTGGGGGGGGTGGPYDILLLVTDPASMQATETLIKDHLIAEGHTVTLRDAGASEITVTDDLLIIADAGGLGNKYKAQAIPTVLLEVGAWSQHGLITSGSLTYSWASQMVITDPTHDLAAGLTGTQAFLTTSSGIAYADATGTNTPFGGATPDLVANMISTGQHTLFGYESGQTMATGTAAERRVALSGMHASNASPTAAGWSLLDAALDWATDNTSNSGGGGGSAWVESGEIYTYDNRGNRLTAGTDTFEYDGRNRLEKDPDGAYVWNPDGTLDTFTPSSGPAEVYSFDAGGRLTQIADGTNTTSYVYDAADRITSRDGTAFTYAGGELDPTSDGTDLFHRSPSGQLLAYETGAGTSHPFSLGHHDLNGLFGPDGTLTDTRTYDPYGDPIAETGTTDPVLGFQSDYTDPDTEHVWMGARWYQPSSGTFLSRDTVFGDLQTPFSLNRYTYGINNPNRYWDPTGESNVFADELNGARQAKIEARKVRQTQHFRRIESTDQRISKPRSSTDIRLIASQENYKVIKRNTTAEDSEGLVGKGMPIPGFFGISVDISLSGVSFNNTYNGPDIPEYRVTCASYDPICRYAGRGVTQYVVDTGTGLANSALKPVDTISSTASMIPILATASNEVHRCLLANRDACNNVASTTQELGVAARNSVVATCDAEGLSYCISYYGGGAALEVGTAFIPGAHADDGIQIARLAEKGTDAVRVANKGDDVISFIRRAVDGCGPTSFVPGTLVLMADGTTKLIEKVEIGDYVWAADPETGEAGSRKVVGLITGIGEKTLVDITVDDNTVTSTDNHPIWVNNRGEWVDALDVQEGDYLLDEEGVSLLVSGTSIREASGQTVHNLTVDGLHTFFVLVGDQTVLTHNAGCGPNAPNGAGRIPWTSFDDYPKVTINGRQYADVGGRPYTQHGVDRLQPSGLGSSAAPGGALGPGRSISPNYVDDVLTSSYTVRKPVTGPLGEARVSHVSGTVEVITEGDIVITVITRWWA